MPGAISTVHESLHFELNLVLLLVTTSCCLSHEYKPIKDRWYTYLPLAKSRLVHSGAALPQLYIPGKLDF